MPIHILNKIWPEWSIEKRIGGGAYGTVYEASRNEYGVENHAAIKIISIPSNESEVDALQSEGLDMQGTKRHFQTMVDEFVGEIRLMVSLEGHPNIVNVRDYKVVEKDGEFGWYIFILMELLTPFSVYSRDRQLSEREVIQLGCDICTALEICDKENIIHRDIKPGNIMVHKSGAFKLGDFGIARKLENMTSGLSQRYTPKYMAPEVAVSKFYDKRVDIYSLGIVLYELLNDRRIPFQPNRQINSLSEIENALRRRNSGEPLPAPCSASAEMADLILCACAYEPEQRFSSASEMKQALLRVANGTYQVSAEQLERTTSVRKAPGGYDSTTSVRKPTVPGNQQAAPAVDTFGPEQPSKSKLPVMIISVLLVAGLVAAGYFGMGFWNKKKEIDTMIDAAEILARIEDYSGAIAKIEKSMEEYPDEDKLQDKLEEYQAALENQRNDGSPASPSDSSETEIPNPKADDGDAEHVESQNNENHPEPAPGEEYGSPDESDTLGSDSSSGEDPSAQPTVASVLSGAPSGPVGNKISVIAANASSVVSQAGVNNEPMLLFDGRDETSWQEGVDGYGAGESVAFSFDGTYKVKYLMFKLGNWKNDEYYYGNARPRTLTVILGDFTQEITFSGERRPEWVELSNPVTADSMRIVLGEVYEGTTWADTCIAEIEIYGE